MRQPEAIKAPHMIGELGAAVIRQAVTDAYSLYASDRNDVARFAKSKMLGFWCELAGWEAEEVKSMLLSLRGDREGRICEGS